MAGPDAPGGAARINQDARMFATVLTAGQQVDFPIAGGRYAWVQCVTGNADVNGLAIKAGDGVAVSDEAQIALRGTGPSGAEILLFDLP
jgi:redox-sensitive bicupin YhaK (pirin superfamily)